MNNRLRHILESNKRLERRYLTEDETAVETNALSSTLKEKLGLDDSASKMLSYDNLTQECKTFLEKKSSVSEQDFPACVASLVSKLPMQDMLELLKGYSDISTEVITKVKETK